MNQEFVGRFKEVFEPFMENHLVYFSLSILLYFIGGIDKEILVLFYLNLLNIFFGFYSKENSKIEVLLSKLKIYVVIMLGVIIDDILGISNDSMTSIRNYIIIVYTYQEMLCILNYLNKDKTFFIPSGLKNTVNSLSQEQEKRGVKEDE